MIGAVFRLGRSLEDKPLIIPALYKTVLFSLLVVAFTIVEHAIKGLWMGEGLAAGVMNFLDKGFHELLAGSLVIFVALLPFFAIRELGRVIGTDKLSMLFFRGSKGQKVGDDR